SVALTVHGIGGTTAGDNLVVHVVDDVPLAANDGPAGVVEDGASLVSGSVLTNDASGADTPKSFVAWDAITDAASVAALNSYGTLVQNGNGTWSYTLNNSLAATQALTAASSLSYTLHYTMQDADGDTSPATLTITIQGADDSASVVTAQATGADATVLEAGLTPNGSSAGDGTTTTTGNFTISATDGVQDIVIGGVTFTLAEIQAFGTTNGVVNTGQGVLTLTGYTGDSFGGTVNYSYTLPATIDNDSVTATGNDAVNGAGFDDSVALTVHGIGGTTAGDNLVVHVVDDVPTAVADTDSVTEDGPTVATGNVIAGGTDAGDSNTTDGNADTKGADGATVFAVSSVNLATSGTVGSSFAGQYGTLTLNANGTYTYTLNNGLAAVQNLNNGQTLEDKFSYTIRDGDTDQSTAQLTITINGVNDNAAPIVADTHNWMPSDPAQQSPNYTDGYPLLVNVPTDPNGDPLVVTANGTVPTGLFYYDGSYHAVTAGMTLFDTVSGVNLLDNLVYRPTATVTDTVNVALTLDVYDGTVHATETVNIHEVAPTSTPGPTGNIAGDANNPLTSGNDADATFTLSAAFAAAVDNDPSAGSITLRTDFQHRPGYSVPIQAGDQNGNDLEAQVDVYIYVDGIKFQAISHLDGNANTWLFDGQLMKAVVDFDSIINTTNPGQSLAQYIALNPVVAGETWTIQYDDNTPGNEQARLLTFALEVFDPGNPAITVSGNTTLSDLIYGGSGSDTLSGNGGDDTIIGRGGNDIINGGAGSDTLTGGTGADHFRYGAPSEGLDHILDFSTAEGDTVDILLSGFTGAGLALGSPTAAQFGSDASNDFGAAERFHFNTATHTLLYDADGGSGAGAAIAMAVLENGGTVDAAHIKMV
ncbi:S-layer family protein, partial [Bradyrhizobium sp. AUGA SZCCT0431]|uniref:beta strand repeat-containing protein n=1 Tax=Bradyrhizobium sp. AUGA SZCCT0431 TaxID=2807674 RepID=UPI001BADCB67